MSNLITVLRTSKFLVALSLFTFSKAQTQGTDKKSVDRIVAFLNFEENTHVADIGSGDMKRIVRLASYFPGTYFTLQDIDSVSCNVSNLKKQVRKNGNRIALKNFQIVYGDVHATHLGAAHYDHVTIFACLHEFTDSHFMLQDIKNALKEGGFLYIFEDLTSDSVTLTCPYGAQYFQRSQFYALLKAEGIRIVEQQTILEDPDLQEIIFKCTFY